MQENIDEQDKDGLTFSISLDKRVQEKDGCKWWKVN